MIAFAYQGISYATREKVIDIGLVHMTAEKNRTLPLPLDILKKRYAKNEIDKEEFDRKKKELES